MKLFNINSYGSSVEAVIYVKPEFRKRKTIAVIKSPDRKIYHSDTVPVEEAVQLELFLGLAGHHIVFFDSNLVIINDTYRVLMTVEDPWFRDIILACIKEGEILMEEFLERIIYSYCKLNQARVLVSKPTAEPDFKTRHFLFTAEK
jgi:hypothetical protein